MTITQCFEAMLTMSNWAFDVVIALHKYGLLSPNAELAFNALMALSED